jgi:serine protease Do
MNENENKLNEQLNNEAVENTTSEATDNIIEDNIETTSDIINTDTYNITDELPTEDDVLNLDISDEDEPKAKHKSTRIAYKRTIALGLAGTIFCGASLGLSLGVGLNISKNLFSGGIGNFSFAQNTDENATIDASATGLTLTPSEDSVAKVFNQVKDSVVNISITVQSSGYFNQTYESTGSGSGIIYSQDDEKVFIVTNNHVVDGASSVKISITGSEQVSAKLVGKDASSDLAVISVLKSDLNAAGITSVTPAVFGDSDNMEVGEFVIAIGNALGQGKTATRGIISALNKEINVDGKKLTVLQTDAAINPGNSGGALVNTAGEVVGINTAKLSSSSVEGMGYSIPTSVAKSIIEELMQKGTVDKPYLGISVYTINDQFKRMYNINYDGVFITNVESGSAAEQAGLQTTDIITGVNGQTVTSSEELSNALSKYKSGEQITLSIIRNGSTQMNITATLANQNEQF